MSVDRIQQILSGEIDFRSVFVNEEDMNLL